MPITRGRITIVTLLAATLSAGPLSAQQEAIVEAIAPVLMAEDARQWNAEVFRRGLEYPDPLVRRKTALAVGRLKDVRGTSLLLDHLLDPDSTVQVAVMFGLGLMQDTAAVEQVIARFSDRPGLWREAAQEGITALAKIRDRRVPAFFAGILRGTQNLTVDSIPLVRIQVAQELWRLEAAAPVADLVSFMQDTVIDLRRGAIYSVARLRAPVAGANLLLALRDEIPLLRSWAARALTRAYADSAKLGYVAVTAALRNLLADEDPGVRINALRSLATFRQPELSDAVAPLLDDSDINTRVQAAATLGATGGTVAAEALDRIVRSREPFAVRREALLSLAQVDSSAFLAAAPTWLASSDWRDRAAAVESWAALNPTSNRGRPTIENERDGRVIAAALQAWRGSTVDSTLIGLGRHLVNHPDAAVRSVAADLLAQAGLPADVPALIAAYKRTAGDSFPDAALSVLAALDSIGSKDQTVARQIERDFLDVTPRPRSYVIRRWAESSWPEAAERWGPAYPIETGRTLEDYRDVSRRFVVGTDPSRYPHVFLETDQRNIIELELFGPEAPLTVANFLMLVDRHFFDGNTWHRVVPNFVLQDGDRRGDGWGGPGGEIRDEVNRRRYGSQVLGMALSGPDTGSSQWFITHSPQPHLDGTYTVFGRVLNGGGFISRISQGDRIQTIRR